MDNWHLT